ncbi:MAG: hypothetical protein O6949_01875, partial [Chloroflexi bacterium]|nr:hypothetical protein [Chloroflexota bacterium]
GSEGSLCDPDIVKRRDSHEGWHEASRYLNMEPLRDHKKDQLRRIAVKDCPNQPASLYRPRVRTQ